MVHKKGSQLGKCLAKLTKTERIVFKYLTEDFLTAKKIALARGTTARAVYKVITSLKKKGVLGKAYKKVHFLESTNAPYGNKYRLHGVEFNVRLLGSSDLYDKIKSNANHVFVDDNTIRLYDGYIEIYVSKSFFGDSVQSATAKSNKYINRLFLKIENDFKVLLVKDRSHNVKLVNAHYSEINNGLAKDCNVKKERIKVYSDRGKLWFLIDNSFNLNEAETIDPLRSKHDMEKVVGRFFNDLRDNEPVTMGEIKKVIYSLVVENKETAAGLNSIVQLFRSQFNVQDNKEEIKRTPPKYIG